VADYQKCQDLGLQVKLGNIAGKHSDVSEKFEALVTKTITSPKEIHNDIRKNGFALFCNEVREILSQELAQIPNDADHNNKEEGVIDF
jgi:hypothetical protein